MKVLFIVPYVPNLIRVRPYNLIRHLALLGHSVSVAAIVSDATENEDILRLKGICGDVFTTTIPAWKSMIQSLLAFPQHIPMQARYSWDPAFARQIRSVVETNLAESAFDVIHVEHVRGMEYGLHLLKPGRAESKRIVQPVVWDSVDCISSLMQQTARYGSSLKSRVTGALEYRNTARYEAMGVRSFDRVLVTSPMDRKDLARTTGGDSRSVKIDVLQNGVDLKYFLPGEGKRHKETIVVSGKMSYHANIAMVKHLVEVIMPQIWAQKPEAKLQIVGKDPPRLIRAMGEQPRVTVTGTVSDIRPYLQKATLAVVPITYGTGIQNKILEAMACATPVVVSSHAASSLQAVEGHEVLVADTASDFASAVLALLGDSGRRTSLGTAGRSYVERNHDWFRVAAQLVDIYDMAIQERRWASRR